MSRLIFVNLPVTDLDQSLSHYQAMGWTLNPQFSDETAACMVWSDTIHTMLLTHEKWQSFTQRLIPDAQTTAQVMLALSVESRDQVNQRVEASAATGGQADPNPPIDLPFMFSRSLADPDGHIWELMWMDPKAVERSQNDPTQDPHPAAY